MPRRLCHQQQRPSTVEPWKRAQWRSGRERKIHEETPSIGTARRGTAQHNISTQHVVNAKPNAGATHVTKRSNEQRDTRCPIAGLVPAAWTRAASAAVDTAATGDDDDG